MLKKKHVKAGKICKTSFNYRDNILSSFWFSTTSSFLLLSGLLSLLLTHQLDKPCLPEKPDVKDGRCDNNAGSKEEVKGSNGDIHTIYVGETSRTVQERAVEHWDHYIRENENPTTCLVDNNPVVQCAKKLANGEYSESPRLQSFLYLLNSKNLNIQHNSAKIPNKLIESVDWGSRNHVECKEDKDLPGMHENCPYCDLAWKNDDISFAPVRRADVTIIDTVKSFAADIEEVMRRPSSVPFKTRSSWINIQRTCADMRKAVAHIKAGTVPSPKEKNIRDARYYIQHCKVDKDGLLVHEKQAVWQFEHLILLRIVSDFDYLR